MLANGEILNERYRIEKVLGEGGMGIVYLGWDLTAERFVALKEIKASSSDYQKYIEQVKKEVKALAKLNHPNIVIFYDLIQYQDNWYIIMEYVEGMTLDKKLEHSGAVPHEQAILIFKQMLAALDHAHRADVVHRDIKPGNVMITPEGQVKLMDFGLAKIQPLGSLARSRKSEHTGGTLYYLSPELVEGKPIDQCSDIYSLGMTCYEVLAGSTPLKDKTTTVAILNAILDDHFPPPTDFNANVPKALSEIVLHAIALEPGRRFQSAREMLEEVEKFEVEWKKQHDPSEGKGGRITLMLYIAWGIITGALVLTLITIFAVPDLPLRMLKWIGLRSPTKVSITTEPADVEIKLGGKSAGKSPLKSRYVDEDTLIVSIQKASYFSIDTAIALKGVLEKPLAFTLIPAATFALVVVPDSAEVMIDGKIIPSAEREHIELVVGQHDLRISAEGYETRDEKIFLRQGLNAPRTDTLKQVMITALSPSPPDSQTKGPLATAPKDSEAVVAAVPTPAVETPVQTGILTLTINPPSEVYLGDSVAAKAATQGSFTLARGNHALKVVHPTLGRWLETILITGQNASREIDFTQKYTIRILAIDLNDEPITATIYLDGRPAGKSTPDQLSLNCGYHEIEVRLEGYEPERNGFNVEKNGKIEFKLKRAR